MASKVKNSCQNKVVSKVIMFEKTLEFRATILLCMANKKFECVVMSLKAKCGPLLKLSLHV